MGLDQYAYARPPRKRNSDDDENLCEWRKHNRLQGYMESVWESKGCPNRKVDDDGEIIEDFNCVELQLTSSDIDELEYAIDNFELPESNGFFWGSDSYFWHDEDGKPFPENEYYYKEQDLNFISEARKMLDKGYRIYYTCWY
jgi:hypothetical protein